MATFTVHREYRDETEYTVDTRRKFEGYKSGDIICGITPFFGIPLQLEIAIRDTGELIFRSWNWIKGENGYLHLISYSGDQPTQNQFDTVAGLFSNRIPFEGLELPPGSTLQKLCPIDIEAEEKRIGKKIYLA